MPSPLSVKKNDYISNPKRSDIYTPQWLSRQIHTILLSAGFGDNSHVFDPAIGHGALTIPFTDSGHNKISGCDILAVPGYVTCANGGKYLTKRFEEVERGEIDTPDIIVCNPPFNAASGRKLYPEVFLRHIEFLFGSKVPTVMIVPMGMRLNQRKNSIRWKYIRDTWEITSVIALPIDTFECVLFHCEVLFFNVNGIKPHYFSEI